MMLPDRSVILDCAQRLGCIVITPAGRGGSLLLQSLLDGHPQVTGFPDAPLEYDYFDSFRACGGDIVRWLDEQMHILDGSQAFADQDNDFSKRVHEIAAQRRPGAIAAFEHICAALGGVEHLDRRGFMATLNMAWAVASGQRLECLQYFVFHHHNNRLVVKDLPQIARDFTRLRVLVTCRHPIESALSFKTLCQRQGIHSFHNFSRNVRGWSVKPFLNVFKMRVRCISDDQLRLIDLGDLHLRQGELLRKLTSWLNIDFNTSLESATVSGVSWMGNSADGKPIPTFEPRRAKLTYLAAMELPGGLTGDEYRYTRWFTRELLEQFGYEDPVVQEEVGIVEFLSVILRNMEWVQPDSIHYGTGLRRLLRRFGVVELMLIALQWLEMRRVRPVESAGLRL